MHIRKFITRLTLIACAFGITAGEAGAAPVEYPVINVRADATPEAAIIHADAGSMVVEDEVFKIKGANGVTVAGADLKFRLDEFELPIVADISGRTATLTPQFDIAKAVYRPVVSPYGESDPGQSEFDREQRAYQRLQSTLATGTAIATLVGGLGGIAVGCLLGGLTGLTVAAATIIGLLGALPAALLGCLGGILSSGALTTLAGPLLAAAPVVILAAVQYFSASHDFPRR